MVLSRRRRHLLLCCLQLQDKSLEVTPPVPVPVGSFYQQLQPQQPPSPSMFPYSQISASGAEFSRRPVSQPMQTCYYSSPLHQPSSPCQYGSSPVTRHVPSESLPLQFNLTTSPQHSKIPDIILTGNCFLGPDSQNILLLLLLC